jgi:hypothetical protein
VTVTRCHDKVPSVTEQPDKLQQEMDKSGTVGHFNSRLSRGGSDVSEDQARRLMGIFVWRGISLSASVRLNLVGPWRQVVMELKRRPKRVSSRVSDTRR